MQKWKLNLRNRFSCLHDSLFVSLLANLCSSPTSRYCEFLPCAAETSTAEYWLVLQTVMSCQKTRKAWNKCSLFTIHKYKIHLDIQCTTKVTLLNAFQCTVPKATTLPDIHKKNKLVCKWKPLANQCSPFYSECCCCSVHDDCGLLRQIRALQELFM